MTPTKCKVTYDDKRKAEKVLGLNERKLDGSGCRKIRACAVEARVTLWEAINHIQDKLESEERKQLKKNWPSESHQPSHQPRRTYVVEGELHSDNEVRVVKSEPPRSPENRTRPQAPPATPVQSPPAPTVDLQRNELFAFLGLHLVLDVVDGLPQSYTRLHRTSPDFATP